MCFDSPHCQYDRTPIAIFPTGRTAKNYFPHPVNLTADDFAKLPRRAVRAKDHDGKEATYEGVELGEVLKLAGVKFGDGLRGKNLVLFLVVRAADNYRAVFALPELDQAFTEKVVLLADTRDGKPLTGTEGRLHLIVPDEKRAARWVRQVISLTIRRADWTDGRERAINPHRVILPG